MIVNLLKVEEIQGEALRLCSTGVLREPVPATPKGKEITAAVTLPKISPRKLLNRIKLVIFINGRWNCKVSLAFGQAPGLNRHVDRIGNF